MTMALHLVLLLGALFHMASCCSFPPGLEPKIYTMEETLELAPFVVSGVSVQQVDFGPDQPVRNYTFDVSCIFKTNSTSDEIPATIFLIDVGATSCDGTFMEEGKSYVVALKRATAVDLNRGGTGDVPSDLSQYFKVFEPEASNTGAFEISNDVLSRVSMICSLNDEFISVGQVDNCPAARNRTCTSAAELLQTQRLLPTFIMAMMCIALILTQGFFSA